MIHANHLQSKKARSRKATGEHFRLPDESDRRSPVRKSNRKHEQISHTKEPERHERVYGTGQSDHVLFILGLKKIDGRSQRYSEINQAVGVVRRK